ncbi:RagB/SusD family nutrient uptake outer membrane protein [Mucilaginibacter sp. HC2]|uniref:RagB/SusD family nutrient uptake outer membrane protein n=1 Tax=Mucilaginibacter inviolabilis TaxID=2714892 RepID=UPI0014099CF9|nr:RagB/SusD family nutrient uptake outer membrane protein [Mucilaginibacter inviolabilis]NHA07348.1 RagB/SusD family nutrient uptake outer membrane protein [Mucilaginibacter inviolabilis]
MKKLKYIFLPLIFVALSITACKKSYLETAPTSQVDNSGVFTTTTNAMAALNGIHRSLYTQYNNTQNQGGESGIMIDLDMLGEDLVNTSAGNGWFNNMYKWISHRSATSIDDKFPYQFYYQIIVNANFIIEKVGGATGPQADKDLIKAEALCYRAWAHFVLVQLYGKRYDSAGNNTQPGVPILTTSTITPQPRATVEAVYTQINKDIDDAVALFATATASPNKSHFSINVAKGLRARIALTQGNWAKAAQNASEAKAGLSLMSNADYTAGFNDYKNVEWMWGSHQVEDQTQYFYSFFAYMSANYNSSNIRANPKAINSLLYDQIAATDIRKTLWDPTGKNTAFPIPTSTSTRAKYMNRKFLVAGTTSIGDVPHMRVAEMYLIEAEARAKAGETANAQAVLYTLAKNRNPGYVQSTNTGDALINEILIQRRVELWGEGFRFLDLKRLNLPLDRKNSNHTTALAQTLSEVVGDVRWQWLIPQDEINANPAIGPSGQNP